MCISRHSKNIAQRTTGTSSLKLQASLVRRRFVASFSHSAKYTTHSLVAWTTPHLLGSFQNCWRTTRISVNSSEDRERKLQINCIPSAHTAFQNLFNHTPRPCFITHMRKVACLSILYRLYFGVCLKAPPAHSSLLPSDSETYSGVLSLLD